MKPSTVQPEEITVARRRAAPLGWRKGADAPSAPEGETVPSGAATGETTPGAPAAEVAPSAGEPVTSFRVIRLDSPAHPADAPVPDPAVADQAAPAPRRAVPLAPPTAKELAAAREIAQAAARPRLAARAAAAKAARPAIEKKIAGATDSDEMIQVIDVELALQRARRLSGAADKQREMLRVLSVLMLFGLVIAVVGAMWYLQTLRQGRANLSRQRAAAVGK